MSWPETLEVCLSFFLPQRPKLYHKIKKAQLFLQTLDPNFILWVKGTFLWEDHNANLLNDENKQKGFKRRIRTDLVGMRSNGCGSAAKRLEALSDTNHRETSGLKRPSGQRAQKLKYFQRNEKSNKSYFHIFKKKSYFHIFFKKMSLASKKLSTHRKGCKPNKVVVTRWKFQTTAASEILQISVWSPGRISGT